MKSKIALISFVFFTSVAVAQKLDKALWKELLNFSDELFSKKSIDPVSTNAYVYKFKLDSTKNNTQIYKDKFGHRLVLYKHIETGENVYIEFFENKNLYHELKTFLINDLKFEWTASEHMCDYLLNSRFSLTICPGMNNGVMVNISLSNNKE